MKVRWWIALLGLPLALLLKGCGANQEDKSGVSKAEVKEATAVRTTYHDWESVQLQNGLVTVSVVPQLGGRVMGFDFGERPLIYANPKLQGRAPGEPGHRQEPWVPGTTAATPSASEPAASTRPSELGTHSTEAAPKPTAPDETPAGARDVPGGGLRMAEAPVATPTPAPSAAPAAKPETKAEAGTAQGKGSIGEQGSKPDMTTGEEVAPHAAAGKLPTEPLRQVPSPTTEKYTNYGGAFSWPAPQSHWSKPWPPPVPLDLGAYAVALPKTDGDTVEVELTGPKDDQLGLQETKRLALVRGSTVLRVTTTLRNVGANMRVWAVADVSQHPGALTAGESFTKDVQVFLPLSGTSQYQAGFATLLGPPTSPQYNPEQGIMRVDYLGEEGMVGSDDHRGWVAYADKRHETVLVKLANLPPQGSYPEGGLAATVYTAPSKTESYVQMALRSPLAEVAPNDQTSLSVTYAAAACPLPIVNATGAGVVNKPLLAEKLGDSVHLTGVFGVFYSGYAQTVFYDKQGQPLSRTEPVAVSPVQPYRLDSMAAVPDGAVRAAVLISNHRRVDVGTLSDAGITDIKPNEQKDLAIKPDTPTPPAGASVPSVKPVTEPAPATAPASPMPAATEPGSGATPAGKDTVTAAPKASTPDTK